MLEGNDRPRSGGTTRLRRYMILAVVALCVLSVLSVFSAGAAPSPSGATIASDLADYPPGATVTLTGTGWAADESVHIFVNDDVGQTWSLNSDPDPRADGNGSFTYIFQLPNSFVANYSVTAGPGRLGSGMATTTFTDNDTYDWSQCKNDVGGGSPLSGGSTNDNKMDYCQWVNGNLGPSNSIYTEGDVVPQRAIRTVATTGAHSITFDH